MIEIATINSMSEKARRLSIHPLRSARSVGTPPLPRSSPEPREGAAGCLTLPPQGYCGCTRDPAAPQSDGVVPV